MSTPVVAPVSPRSAGALRPVSLTDYRITGGFWANVQDLNREAIIPHCDSSLERVGWVENFRAAARGTLAQERTGRLFTDSEIYKTMEAMAWENARQPDPGLADRLAEYTALLARVQHEDGYLNTFYGYDGGPGRYTDLEWGHELYCAGHLLQAAVAALRTDGPADLAGIACRLADHVCDRFGEGGDPGLCGHPEIETALVELYRVTGHRPYLALATRFVDLRGHGLLGADRFGPRYFQDHTPVRDADEVTGHVVRQVYLLAGAVDVAVENGDGDLLRATERLWDSALSRRPT